MPSKQSLGGKLDAERLIETPATSSGTPPSVIFNCLRCGRKCGDYICEKCSLMETET